MRKVRYEIHLYDDVTDTDHTEVHEGLFHQWAQYQGGDEAYPVAIIEEPDGHIVTVEADFVQFTDKPPEAAL